MLEHPSRYLGDGDWWGCEFPERPFDREHTRFFRGCRPCLLAAQAAAMQGFASHERAGRTLTSWITGGCAS